MAAPFGVSALTVLLALGCLHRALWGNHRYRFTTWRWGRVLAAILLVGALSRLLMSA